MNKKITELGKRLEAEISNTATGELRNLLCDANITIQALNIPSVGHSWIDTTELLPPLKTPILFVAETEVKYGQRGIYTTDDFECQAEMYRDGDFEVYKKEFVTKWMFLPKL